MAVKKQILIRLPRGAAMLLFSALLVAGMTLNAMAQILRHSFDEAGIASACGAAISNGDWNVCSKTLCGFVTAPSPDKMPGNLFPYEKVVKDSLCARALAARAFIETVKPGTLCSIAGSERGKEFLLWLFSNTGAMEDFLETLRPEDNVGRAMGIWKELWAKYPDARDKYSSLAIACALVFDLPLKTRDSEEIDVDTRFRYYVENSDKNWLKFSSADLPPWELVWVVDAAVPPSELEWARSHVNYPASEWEKAYHSIRYRMERVRDGDGFYDEYTLAEILKEGGACVDQGWFATVSAKANGIPAICFFGAGKRGGHCWFAFKESANRWKWDAARYRGEGFTSGYTTESQVGRQVKEQSVRLVDDPQRRSSGYRESSRYAWLAEAFMSVNMDDKALQSIQKAVRLSSRHLAGWNTLIAWMEKTDAPEEMWEKAFKEMRSSFRQYPDTVAQVDAIEREMAVRRGDISAAMKQIEKQLRRTTGEHGERKDLVIAAITDQVELLKTAGQDKEIPKLYENMISEYGRDAPVFCTLSRLYADHARSNGTFHDALKYIGNKFQSYYHEPTRDYFAMTAYAGVLEMMSAFYREDEQESKADELRRRAGRVREKASRYLK